MFISLISWLVGLKSWWYGDVDARIIALLPSEYRAQMQITLNRAQLPTVEQGELLEELISIEHLLKTEKVSSHDVITAFEKWVDARVPVRKCIRTHPKACIECRCKDCRRFLE